MVHILPYLRIWYKISNYILQDRNDKLSEAQITNYASYAVKPVADNFTIIIIIIESGSRTSSGEKTFGYVFSRLSNKFILDKLVLKFSTFKLSMFNNINLIYD